MGCSQNTTFLRRLIYVHKLLFKYYHQNTEYTEKQETAFPVFMVRFKDKNIGISLTMGLVALTSLKTH